MSLYTKTTYVLTCDRCGRDAGPYRAVQSLARDDGHLAGFRQILGDYGHLVDRHVCSTCFAAMSVEHQEKVLAAYKAMMEVWGKPAPGKPVSAT